MKSEQAKKEAEARYKFVTEIYESGITSAAEIARKTSIPPRTVSRLISLWNAGASIEEVKQKGRPLKITPQNRSFIGSEIARNPFISSKELKVRLSEKKEVQVYHQLISGN